MSFVLNTAEELTREIDTLIADLCPTAGRRAMYGGFVFEKEPGNPKTMVCGHFVYKAHVSLEFSQGYALNDSQNVLTGSGKYRRHIKLFRVADIADKRVRPMLEQAFSSD